MSNQPAGGALRKVLLFLVLGILLLALGYEYRVSRPSVDLAYDKITDRSVEVNANTTEILTNDDVRALVGQEPSRTFNDDNGDLVEVYSWKRGLPFLTNDLYTVFKRSGDKQRFHRHSKYGYREGTEVSKFDGSEAIVVKAPDGAESADDEYDSGRSESASDESGGDDAPGDADGDDEPAESEEDSDEDPAP